MSVKIMSEKKKPENKITGQFKNTSLIRPIYLSQTFQSAESLDYKLDIYRGDLEHPNAPGNKWHKLQHHLKEAAKQNATVVATFGGPFSNHLHAFGATLQSLPYRAVAVVRGELQPQLNTTLKDAISHGVELWPSLRSDYKLAMDSDVVKNINDKYGNVYWIPEGGGGELGALGCMDWARQIDTLGGGYDAWVVSAGTGTTAAGLLSYKNTPALHVISALKGAEQQQLEITALSTKIALQSGVLKSGMLKNEVLDAQQQITDKLFFYADEHHGGYAKHSDKLMAFIKDYAASNVDNPLDPVYTCKSMFFIMSAMKLGTWPYSRTLFIHTGGLQGWGGFSDEKNPFLSV